jgi:hypothetical protein
MNYSQTKPLNRSRIKLQINSVLNLWSGNAKLSNTTGDTLHSIYLGISAIQFRTANKQKGTSHIVRICDEQQGSYHTGNIINN